MRLARITLGWSGQAVARRAGVSASTEARVENGDPGVGLATFCAVAEAVGLDAVLRMHEGRPPSLRDTGQLAIAQEIRRQAHPAWQPALELAIGPHGESIDLAFFGPTEIIAAEVERLAMDFQAQYRRADRKREALAARHQRPVRLLLVVEDTRRNRVSMEAHAALIRSALPAGSREVLGALRLGKPLNRDGLLWIRRPADRRA